MQLLSKGDGVKVCSTAWRLFNCIVDTIGGPGERSRRDSLLTDVHCSIVPDAPGIVLEHSQIKLGRKKDTNTLITATTALAARAVLVTSNLGFLNSAWQTSRIHIPAVSHPARALFKA
jgi:hypothetical protein